MPRLTRLLHLWIPPTWLLIGLGVVDVTLLMVLIIRG